MNKDQQSKLRQEIFSKLVEKKVEEKKETFTEEKVPEIETPAPIVEEKVQVEIEPKDPMQSYTERLQAQVRKQPLTEAPNLMGGEAEKPVTQADLRQIKSALASLGGGGVGPAEMEKDFVSLSGDSMSGDLYVPGVHITQDDSNRTVLYYEQMDSTHTLEAKPGEETDYDAWIGHGVPDETIAWRSVAYGDGKFVAVAGGPKSDTNDDVMYSTDGVDWTVIPSSRNGNRWSGITYGGGKFVAVSDNGSNKSMYSTDGITWTGITTAREGSTWQDVAYGDDKYVAVADGPGDENVRIMYSDSDLTSWTMTPMPAADGQDNLRLKAVAYGNGKWVAVGQGPVVGVERAIHSDDGISWSTGLGTQDLGFNPNWYSVAYGDGKFVAVGSGRGIMYSEDGVNWTNEGVTGPPSNVSFYSLVYENGVWIGVGSTYGDTNAAYSYDGLTWYDAATPNTGHRYTGLAYGDNTFVGIAGWSGQAYPNPVMTLEVIETNAGLYWDNALVATERNLKPLISKVNELASVQNVIYQDSDPFLLDSVWAAATYTNGQLWFNSSTPAGQLSIRHNDSWVAI